MNAIGHVTKKIDIDFYVFLGVICRFSINIWIELHIFCLLWEMKGHGSRVNRGEAEALTNPCNPFLTRPQDQWLICFMFESQLFKLSCFHKQLNKLC